MTRLLKRVVNMVVRPRSEWSAIKGEHSTYRDILLRYVAILTLAPVFAVTFSVDAPFLQYSDVSPIYRSAAWHGLWLGLSWYLLNMINVVMIGVVFQRFSPVFASTNDKVHGLKISAYAATPLWLAVPLTVIPVPLFQWICLLALLYSLYLMYLAVVVMMEIPKQKAFRYVAASLLASAVSIGIIDTAVIRLGKFAVQIFLKNA